MCGICGKLVFQERVPPKALIASMCGKIVYRGPDDEGIYTASHIGLGQRRLSIIDLDRQACPPLSNETGTIWIVFNGEIYNFRELRKELEKRGHRFSTRSDTEVIIHLYEEDGVMCLEKLRGMFAFALWDENRKILFCARDRLGQKPFCYTLTSDSFIFGSEIKAIAEDPEVEILPDYGAIDHYLTYQYVPSPMTAFQRIWRLRPGEYLTVDLNGNTEVRSYWEPVPRTQLTISREEMEERLVGELQESVTLRMVSDVPIGAFLSGGIDSATVVAMMARASSTPVKTFSIGFEEAEHNELEYARLVSGRYRTEHQEFIVRPKTVEILEDLVYHYNEPFGDSSVIPTYYVSKITRDFVTVALSGDGGDESFAGYDSYEALMGWNRWNAVPQWFRTPMARGGIHLLHLLPYGNRTSKVIRGLGMIAARDIRERMLQFKTILKAEERQIAYTPHFRDLIDHSLSSCATPAGFPWDQGMDDLDWLMRHDQRHYLPDCLMVKTDIASMANSLEVRSPFLDHRFIEFAASIPSGLKLNRSGRKAILKSAVKDLVPDEILTRPKAGFSIPLAIWLRSDLAPLLREMLLDGRALKRGLFHQAVIRRMVAEHTEGKRDWSNRLWAFLFLEMWFRSFIDGQ